MQKMIEEDRYCMDILVQLAAIKSATNNIGLAILEGHTKSCVSNAIRSGDGEQAISEMMEVLRSFVKSGGHKGGRQAIDDGDQGDDLRRLREPD